MAPRTKEPPKPILAVKFDFYESLDAFIQSGMNLLQAAEFTLAHGDLKSPVHDNLKEQADKFRALLSSV